MNAGLYLGIGLVAVGLIGKTYYALRQAAIRHEWRTRAKERVLSAYQYAIRYGPRRAFETTIETLGVK
jgi:hypothetical protein